MTDMELYDLLKQIDQGYAPNIEEQQLMENQQKLDLSGTEITALPESVGYLKNLEILLLGGTKIAVLPEAIGELPKLKNLDLSGLTLNCIPSALAFRGLPFVNDDEWDDEHIGICVADLTLTEQDLSVFTDTPELIPTLYESEDDLITVHESKVIFLGDGEAGKSYTIQRFLNDGQKETEENPYKTSETPGIEIVDYRVERGEDSFNIHFWDFGGQLILHSMHRCFLTDKTCYVVMVKTRETKSTQRARYWLRNVTSFAPNSPILLYVNCWDNDDGKRAIDESGILRDYPNVKDVVYCSSKQAEDGDFREFMDKLIDMASASVEAREKVPRRWNNLRTALTNENTDYLTKKRYYELCADNEIKDADAAPLLTFFNILGVCFSYHRDREKRELADYKLLNPVWFTNAIYAVIEEGMAFAVNGRIKIKAILQMLGNSAPRIVRDREHRRTIPDILYTASECEYIMDVAEAYNLCYRLDRDTLFFPALCTHNTPVYEMDAPASFTNHMEYNFVYEYLPDTVVHQLMIRFLKNDVSINNCWLRGIVLGGMGNHKAIIRMGSDNNTLQIGIYSRPDSPIYDFFAMIKNEIYGVNHVLNLKAREYIVKGDDSFPLIMLLNYKNRGTDRVFGNNTYNEYRVSELLGEFYDEWNLTSISVENGMITIPKEEIRLHKRTKSDMVLRRALWKVYKGVCQYCGNPISSFSEMQVDHVFPTNCNETDLSKVRPFVDYLQGQGFDINDPNYIENYLPVHSSCNRQKSNHLSTFPLVWYFSRSAKNAPEVLKEMHSDMDSAGLDDISETDMMSFDKTISDYLDSHDNSILKHSNFLNYINSHRNTKLNRYVAIKLPFLFSTTNGDEDITPALEDERTQEMIYQLYLIDTNRIKIEMPVDTMQENQKDDEESEKKEAEKSKKQESEKAQSEKSSTPENLEIAVKMVLDDFYKWLTEDRKDQGVAYEVFSRSHRQTPGLQYGHDVGMTVGTHNERFNLRFECKCYTNNIKEENSISTGTLRVENYAYNLLQFFMHASKEVNNRWILVCPYGDLQNNFPEKLFFNWNDNQHDHLKIYEIAETESTITCKDFLAANIDAYRLFYNAEPEKTKSREQVFEWLNDVVIGNDVVESVIQEKLEEFNMEDGNYKLRSQNTPLISIKTQNQTDALEAVLNALSQIIIPESHQQEPEKYGAYIIGEFGAGKTWLTYQIIEEIVRHPDKYSYTPIFLKLKGIMSGAVKKSTVHGLDLKELARAFVMNNFGKKEKATYYRCKAFVVILDGFDEVLSGLSFTNDKITILYEIIRSIREYFKSSLFVVTSRETDYTACKKNPFFWRIMNKFHEVKLAECAPEQIRANLQNLANRENADKNRLISLSKNDSFVNIMCRPVFYGFLPRIVERPEFERFEDDTLDEYDILESIVQNEIDKLISDSENSMDLDMLYDYAIALTMDNISELKYNYVYTSCELFDEKTVAQYVPVGIMNIRIKKSGNGTEYYVRFQHNIVREFLVIKKMYSLLKQYMTHHIGAEHEKSSFIELFKQIPMTVAMQRLFTSCLQKDKNDGFLIRNQLIELLQDRSIKCDVQTSTKLLEILLLPNSKLCGINAPLDLQGINAHNLYIWNCVLKNIDMRKANIENLQLIDVELSSIDLRDATITNLQMYSEVPIAGITSWFADGTYNIAAALINGKLIIYTLQDQLDLNQTRIKMLNSENASSGDGLFSLDNKLLYFKDGEIFKEGNTRIISLSSMNRVRKIIPTKNAMCYLLEINDNTLAVCFHEDGYDTFFSEKTDSKNYCVMGNGLFAYIRQKGIRSEAVIQHNNNVYAIEGLEYCDCICSSEIERGKAILFVLKDYKITTLILSNDGNIIERKEMNIESDKKFTSVSYISEDTLVATDVDSLFILKLNDDICRPLALSGTVKCKDLILEDIDHSNRVKDNNTYQMLCSMNQQTS